jgi:hypothetical protein
VLDLIEHPDYDYFDKLDLNNVNKPGVYRFFNPNEDAIMRLAQYFRNGMVIFEDARQYDVNKFAKFMERFIINMGQRNIDVVMMFHSFMDIHPAILRKAHAYVMFRCPDPVQRKTLITNYQVVEEAYKKLCRSKKPYHYETVEIY